ncbi:MAG: ABC transporter substrate-binding protein [Clostridiales bacterium]|nr:ABC transporter substrate-binding protein [Clostridiales bacterium]
MKKFIALILGLTLVTSSFTACASGNSASSPTEAGEGQAAVTDNGSEVVFTFAGPNNITQWDPQNENKTNAYMLSKLYYNTLVNPYGEGGAIGPELATEWEVSEDGKSWTFKLREGVKFHNGEVFDSSSVEATLMRLHDNDTLVQAAFWPLLEGVDAVDEYTVTIKLTEPWGALLSQLVDTPMLPPKMLAEKGDAMFEFNDTNKIVGTGPWVCDKWTPGQDAEFVRNEEYWGWGDDKSNVDRIIYKPIIEDTTRVSGIQTGDLDMIDAVPVEQADMLETVDGIKVEKILGSAIVHLGFRTADNRIFGDINARQAVNHAINRELIVSSIAGGGKASSWPCPEGVLGFDPTSPVPEYSVELAKELLGKTSYNGEPISFIAPTGVFARNKEVAQALLAMLTEAGFNVNLEIMENAAFQDRRASGDYDLYLQRYPYPSGDPDSVVTQRWLNDAHKSGYVNEELNAKILEAKSESDPAKREQLLKEMFAIEWAEMAPHMSLYQQVTTVAYGSDITGLRLRIDNVFDYSRVSKGA